MFPKKLCASLGLQVTPEVEAQIDEVKSRIDLFDVVNVGRFGAPEQSKHDLGHEHNEAVSGISSAITGLVGALDKADPRLALKRKKIGLIARFTGGDAVQKVEYVRSTESIDRQLAGVPERISRLERIVNILEEDYQALMSVQRELKVHLVAGKWFLKEHPDAGGGGNDFGLGSPRERFSKRLDNLVALLTSNDSALHQIQLLRANSINMLDRLHEITTVLVPTWRSHRMSLYVNDQDYQAIREATRAHEALVESLKSV